MSTLLTGHLNRIQPMCMVWPMARNGARGSLRAWEPLGSLATSSLHLEEEVRTGCGVTQALVVGGARALGPLHTLPATSALEHSGGGASQGLQNLCPASSSFCPPIPLCSPSPRPISRAKYKWQPFEGMLLSPWLSPKVVVTSRLLHQCYSEVWVRPHLAACWVWLCSLSE